MMSSNQMSSFLYPNPTNLCMTHRKKCLFSNLNDK